MATTIAMTIEGIELTAELYEGPAPRAFAEALPLSASLSRWGDEYYGGIAAVIEEDGTERTIMEVGEVAFWPPGNALCIFFGPTPASSDDRPRAASEVVPLGRITGDAARLKSLGSSVGITITTG